MATKTAAKTAAPKTGKTTAKTTTTRKATPKVAAAPIVQENENSMSHEAEDEGDGPAKVVAQMKVKDLIDRVATALDHNKKEVRAIVEATLVELGRALEAGESLNLPPFGRVRIANQKSDASGQMMTLKLRRGGEKKPAKNHGEALAAADEAS